MGKPSYIKRRGHSYYWQLAVPRSLRNALGKAMIGGALHTRDVAEAHARSWVEIARAKEHFARLQGRIRGAEDTVPPHSLLQIDAAARAYYHELLRAMDAEVSKGVRAWGEDELKRNWDEACVGYCANTDFASVALALAAYCTQHTIKSGSTHYYAAGEALLSARMQAMMGRMAALEGSPSDAPVTFLDRLPIDPVSLRPLTVRRGLRFSEAADKFLAERQRNSEYALSEQSRAIYETVFRLFDSWGGQPTLEEIDRRRASDFIDAVSSLDPRWGRSPGSQHLSFAVIAAKFGNHKPGLSARTVNRYVMALGQIWKFAEKRLGFEGKNVWFGQRQPTAKHRGDANSGKRPFTSAEVRKLLEQRPTLALDAANSLRWIARIAAYSGMRLEEIASLATNDVQLADGIHYFKVSKSKSKAGVRVVPIHSETLACGFLEYVRSGTDGSLWPALKARSLDGKRGRRITKMFAKLRRDLGLIDIDTGTGRGRDGLSFP